MTKKTPIVLASFLAFILLTYFLSYRNCTSQVTEKNIIEKRNEYVEKKRAECLEEQSQYQKSSEIKGISGCYSMTVEFTSEKDAVSRGIEACKVNPFSVWFQNS